MIKGILIFACVLMWLILLGTDYRRYCRMRQIIEKIEKADKMFEISQMEGTEKMIDLKPCPFCGKSERLLLHYGVDSQTIVGISCLECDLMMGHINGIEDVSGKWNRRSGEDE